MEGMTTPHSPPPPHPAALGQYRTWHSRALGPTRSALTSVPPTSVPPHPATPPHTTSLSVAPYPTSEHP
eukprot:1737082-Rhodomonas_salina.2